MSAFMNEPRPTPTPAQIAAAEAFRQWEAARWAANPRPGQDSSYGMKCTLCGDPCTSFVCRRCAPSTRSL